jgi:hypothetical protein
MLKYAFTRAIAGHFLTTGRPFLKVDRGLADKP